MIFFLSESDPAADPCGHYRCGLPMRGLRAHGVPAFVVDALDELPGARIGLTGYPVPDVVVMRRPAANVASAIRRAREAGQVIAIDLDDDPWHLPPTNPAAKLAHNGPKGLARLAANLDAADVVLCSTAPLARVVAEQTSTPVAVCRNGITFPRRGSGHNDRDPLRVGWAGAVAWRGEDLRSIGAELADVLADAPGPVEFWHLGTTLDDPHSVRYYLPVGFPVSIRKAPWVPLPHLTDLLQLVDLLVIPQAEPHSPFSQSRSPTSGLAAAVAGVPFVATPTLPYTETFGAHRPSLAELVASAELRRHSAGRNAQVAASLSPAHVARDWLAALELAGARLSATGEG